MRSFRWSQGSPVWPLMNRTVLFVGVLLASFLIGQFTPFVAYGADEDSATHAVKETIDHVLGVLGNQDLKTPERAEEHPNK